MQILKKPVINGYQKKSSWYHPTRGHTGVDQLFNHELLESPVRGVVKRLATQPEMGNCLYLEDLRGNIHVFAHLSEYKCKVGEIVAQNQVIMKSGNTGSKTTGPHLHYEIITSRPIEETDKHMVRKLWEFSGYNCDPIKYLKEISKPPISTGEWIISKKIEELLEELDKAGYTIARKEDIPQADWILSDKLIAFLKEKREQKIPQADWINSTKLDDLLDKQ